MATIMGRVIIAETGVEAPAERREPAQPFGDEHVPKRGLHEGSGSFTAQAAVRHAPA